MAALAAMLDTAGRGEALERLYCAARLPPLQALWDGFTPGTPFASWLPSFYDQVGWGGGRWGGVKGGEGVGWRHCLMSVDGRLKACQKAAALVTHWSRAAGLLHDEILKPS